MDTATQQIENGLFDLSDQCWLGSATGPWHSDDQLKARIAAGIATEQLGHRIIARPLPPAPFRFKDEVPTKMSPLQAIQKIEGFCEL